MKNLLTICLIMATTFSVNAQNDKPTKGEVIDFMTSVLNGSKGTEMADNYFINRIEFDGNKYSYSCGKKMGYTGFTTESINIPWNEFKEFDSDYEVTNDIISVRLKFYIKVVGALYLNAGNGNTSRSDTYQDGFVMIIPAIKVESFKKGIRRLVEIAKEENKDPFRN